MPTTQQFAEVNGKRIAYLEAGAGDPIVLLHGNPTSSFCGATSSLRLRVWARDCTRPDWPGRLREATRE